MNKQDNPIVLILALLITAGLLGGGYLFFTKLRPGLVPSLGNTTANNPAKGQFTILGDTFSGYSTFRSEDFQKALEETGLSLNYQNEFDQALRAQMLDKGQADLLVTTLDQYLQHQPEAKIVGLIDRTIGADAVVLNTPKYPNLKSLLDLSKLQNEAKSQNKVLSIAYAGDTPSEYLALVLSTKFEAFNLADFEVIKVADASEAWELLQDPSKDVAVAVIWEPYVTQAKQKGYTVVLSSKDAPNAIVDIIAASNRVIESQPEKISELLAAYYRRIDSNVSQPSQLQAQIAGDGGLPTNEAKAVLQGIDFFTSLETRDWMNQGTLIQRITSTAATLALAGRIENVPPNPEQLFTSQLIKKASESTESLVNLVKADNPELADKLLGKSSTNTEAPKQLQPEEISQAPDIGNLKVRGEVKFTSGSAELTSEGKQTLDKLSSEIKEFNKQTVAVRIIGHTSKTGSSDINQKLSKARADVVVQYLKNKSLDHNLVAEGRGFSSLLPNIPPESSQQQRTEIRLVRVN